MKLFEFNNGFGNVEYPEDCQLIWNYLEDTGKINFSKKEVAKYYRIYSDEVWSAGWLSIDDNILYGFAEWLSEQDI